jgi:hypothetical protein
MAHLRFWSSLFIVACMATAPCNRASAISADIAKKCDALTAKAFPPRILGNPAAGSAEGTGTQQLDYFRNCVKNSGKTERSSEHKTK